ncbi:MAG TPA: malto-oligosyltrehalose trehalohydrolase [Trueperaceae bacterium]
MVDSELFRPSLGAVVADEGVRFTVWSPANESVELLIEGSGEALALERESSGFHSLEVEGSGAGARYRYRVGQAVMPDPASRYQPEGVHGPSQVVDPASYTWRNGQPEVAGSGVIYELHLGTFTPEGTFTAACERLPYLAELGVDTIELMPVHDFPGRWNWGYDPASFFAPSRAYGTPDELRCLVDDAHGLGMRVLCDVVYNHFGPDGAYWPAFDPNTFTDRHRTPWGDAIDYDGPSSAGVRRFVLENALMWLSEYRFDGLRLDATFAIIDDSHCHLLTELAGLVARLPGPARLLIAEDPRNTRNLLVSRDAGGTGLGGVWADDFHHQIRSRIAGDDRSYFGDFCGSSREIAETINHSWFYRGHHSRHHGRPRGTGTAGLPANLFVYCIQNHDQVGNRPDGARLNHEVSPAAYRAASALLLFAPQTPLLFMGQEWAASTPFYYFTDHQGELGALVSEGRREEFADFEFGDEVPDPQDEKTFRRSRLAWEELERPPHAATLRYYRRLLSLRRELEGGVDVVQVLPAGLALRRGRHLLLVAFESGAEFQLPGEARVLLDSEDPEYEADPAAPLLQHRRARFERAGALLLELSESP